MALLFTDGSATEKDLHTPTTRTSAVVQTPFEAIWVHYQEARFIYPDKLRRLQPALDLIRTGWPQLLDAPPNLFQLHAARGDNGRITSSICAFRDTLETYVVQHAASVAGHPQHMLACIQACLSHINADPAFHYAKMYFRPENRWPVRASHAIAEALDPQLCAFNTSDYLVCDPSVVAPDVLSLLHKEQRVRELEPEAYAAAAALAVAAVGPLRAAALGFTGGASSDLTLRQLHRRFLTIGWRRTRRVLAIEEDGQLAGLALCYATSHVINFSFLCSRTELLVDPQVHSHAHLVTALARASIVEAAARGDSLAVLLVQPEDAAAAEAAGYTATHKQYACFLWARENDEGAPSAIAGITALYEAGARYVHRHDDDGRTVM